MSFRFYRLLSPVIDGVCLILAGATAALGFDIAGLLGHRMAAGEKLWALLGVVWNGVLIAVVLESYDPIVMTNLAWLGATIGGAVAPISLVVFWSVERNSPRTRPRYAWCHYGGLICAAAWPMGWTTTALLRPASHSR